ncbi:T9SS type A sorting domain-containing protein [Chryseobacterium indoltheticum]|uniref:T9SS type A sorting domain-containing protein n=1 Tax=Chryseobacterium indoltheticum TaxID=254 RepID=UPI003F497F18
MFFFVKSPEKVDEFNVFDLAGRKVFSQKNSSELPQLKVLSLAKGNYILQIIDKDGNSTSTQNLLKIKSRRLALVIIAGFHFSKYFFRNIKNVPEG